MKRFLAVVAAVAVGLVVVGGVRAPAEAAPVAGPKTLYEAYPGVEKTITFNGETQYLIGYDTKSGESIYGGKNAVENMVNGVSKDGPDVKTLLSYAALPKAITTEVGVTGRQTEPPDNCRAPDYNKDLRDQRTYGKNGIAAKYLYSLTVWWTYDCRNLHVVAQHSTTGTSLRCYTGSSASAETPVDDYTRHSIGTYHFTFLCGIPDSFDRWISGITRGSRIEWTNSMPDE